MPCLVWFLAGDTGPQVVARFDQAGSALHLIARLLLTQLRGVHRRRASGNSSFGGAQPALAWRPMSVSCRRSVGSAAPWSSGPRSVPAAGSRGGNPLRNVVNNSRYGPTR